MPRDIRVDQDVLINAAGNHQEAADYLARVPASHEQIRAALNSLGPIYGDFRRAAEALLDARKNCYDDQSREHSQVSDNLRLAVSMWTSNEDAAAETFRHLADER